MASSILSHHRPFFNDDVPHTAHTFEPFDAHPDDSLYTSPPLARDTAATYQRNSDSPPFDDSSASTFQPQNHIINHQGVNNPLYQQPDSLAFRAPLDFSSNPFQTSTAFSSAARNRQQPGTGSSGALSHQSSLSALYGPDVGFPPPPASDLFPQPRQPQQPQQTLDYPHNVHQSSQLSVTNGFSEGLPFEHYDLEPPSRGIRHQSSFGGQSNRGASMLNGAGGSGGGESAPLPAANAGLHSGSGGAAPVNGATSYAGVTSGPTLRDTLRDAREPRDPSADARGFGRDGNAPSASTNSGQQEEISTIFVVGFPDDMQEREFQNMFTFSRGFEAATLKIPNKDSTAYSGVGSQSLNVSTGPSAATAPNAPNSSNERRGTITSATYGGASDPYNLVTVNLGGVVVDSRDLPSGTQTSAAWPSSTTGQVQSQAQQPPRKQIIGFAKFATRADALYARDVLQSKRVDAEKSAVLKAEMAKKNLHTKRGVGGPSGNPAPSGLGAQTDAAGARNGAPTREQGSAANIYNSLPTSGVFGSSNGSSLPLVNGALSQIPNPSSITSDLHMSFALSVREREQAALAAMGVSSALGAPLGPVGPEFAERDYLEERVAEYRMRQHQQQQQHGIFSRGADHYHQSVSVSGTSSVSSFSPERAPAVHNPVRPGEIDFDSRGVEGMMGSGVNDMPNELAGGDDIATPLAHRSAWPNEPYHADINFRREQWRNDPERRHLQQDQIRDLQCQTDWHPQAPDPSPLSTSGLQIQHRTNAHLELERGVAEGSESGIGDITLTDPNRPESCVSPQPGFVPCGEQTLLPSPHHPIHNSSPDEDLNQSTPEREQPQESAMLPLPAAVPLPIETLSEEEGLQIDEVVQTSINKEVRKWPRPASATSPSSQSEHDLAHESNLSGDLRFPDTFQKQHSSRSVASSTGSNSPPGMNGISPNSPSRVEEDGGDQISPLDQLAFQSLHHHLPLNRLPRHQLSGQPVTFLQHRTHEMDRGVHFNESIFDTRNTVNRDSNDLGALETRFNDFSINGGPPKPRETSSPLSSPPLQSMNPVVSGRGPSHDSRPNIDQNPPINTLYVGNLPTTPSSSTTNVLLEENLRLAFSRCPGYRKLCFRQKSNGPMCFVEFEDVHYATKALNDMYGHTLNGLIKNGIRLSYSKNPLGVRSPSMSNGSGVGNMSLAGNAGFQSLQDVSSGRHVSVDSGRYGGKGSSYVDTNAPPRRQQLRDEGMQDNRVITNSFDSGVIGPRTARQMSVGPGVGVGVVGDFANGVLGPVSEHSFGRADIGGPNNGTFLPSTTSPPPRLSNRYFSAAPGDAIGTRSALSPVLSNTGASAFSSLSGLGGSYSQPEIASTQHHQTPVRSTFSPFRNDMFGVDQRLDERDQFEHHDSLVGHFPTSTLYNSISFAPLSSNGPGEQR